MPSQRLTIQADLGKVIHPAEAQPHRLLCELRTGSKPPTKSNSSMKILEPRKMPVGRNLHVPRTRQVGAVLTVRTIILQNRAGKRLIVPLSIKRKPFSLSK